MMGLDPRALCQIEIPVTDMAKAIVFYRDAFGWAPVPAEIHDFVVLDVPRDCPFGISLVPQTSAAVQSGRAWAPVLYFACENPPEIVRKAVELGGRVEFGSARILGYGEVTRVEDPDGLRWGLYRRGSIARSTTPQVTSPS